MKVTLNEDDIKAACVEWLYRNHGITVNENYITASASAGNSGRYQPSELEICCDGTSGNPPPPHDGPYR